MFERVTGERSRRARRARDSAAVGVRRWLPDLTAREALGWWLVTRIGIFLIALSAPLLFNRGDSYPDVWRAWWQWDVWHFKAIAEFGYNNGEPSGAPLAAFFPGLPVLMHVASWLGIGYVGGGVLVSAIASAFAGISLARLAQYEFPELRNIGPTASLMWFIAPVGVFLAAAYTEALFCAFAFPAWLAARQGRWARAAILVACAATVRVSGIFLAFALVVEFVTSKKRDWLSLPWLALPAVPVLGFMAYLKQIHGSWFAWQDAQEKGWAREFTWPWTSLVHTFEAASKGHFPADRADWTWMFRAELVALIVGLLLLAWLFWRRSWGEAAWVGATIAAFVTSYWIYSLTRATLLWWPLWIGLAVLAHRKPWLGRLYLALAVPLAVIWACAFFTGRWAG
ncbi:mannosyltransferase PIG-V [Kribbella sp. VKM Ac-2527]|uniref:Mannosyltransferase PIG-V n=1 Tax=Kribbella caucasensis TaxID=2512215 RepID=A0A4R6KQE3_9ACTN|nr:mannosyltransferase family protein [Kribbella sp. VKM Ac-2527]TDO54812.1 mannosyltransferase PIG-V [Kribbella sp. VKM Ac-2527]